MEPLLPHRRWNPLLENWVLVSPHRSNRPWQGALEKETINTLPRYDSSCYLCPGNKRVGESINPDYKSVYVFDNDFSALLEHSELISSEQVETNTVLNGLIATQQVKGICKVICYSPEHNLTMAGLSLPQIEKIISEWEYYYKDLGEKSFINHVMIFENKGEIMGCSNPHPHGQIWATETIPVMPFKSAQSQNKYFNSHSKYLLHDYAEWEIQSQIRIVAENDNWIVVVPFWAVWPFETLILPKGIVSTISDLNNEMKLSWASILKELLIKYDNLFNCSFPYSMGIYQQPTDGQEWKTILHQVLFPPLLRSAFVKKFMVGYELCAEPQRDITPEQAANFLKNSSSIKKA